MSMDEEIHRLFSSSELPIEILGELKSIIKLHGFEPQELFYKWESYSIKMGAASFPDLKTVRDFKKDLTDALERESRGKASVRPDEKRRIGATPRATAPGDVFGMLDGLVPTTPRPGAVGLTSTIKRKGGNLETPANKSNKSSLMSSPNTPYTNGDGTSNFADRPNAGQIMETLNSHLPAPQPSTTTTTESRIKLKANTDLSKFAYKTMAMKLSEASEILDDRIDEFLSLVQAHFELEDSAFGNAAVQSTSEIVAVGRIASEDRTGKLNASSLVLETSRRTGAGFRVTLKVDGLTAFEFFPGKIVALRGTNASGDFFSVTEVLDIPRLPPAASPRGELEAIVSRLESASTTDGDMDVDGASSAQRPLNIMVASGPYTTDAALDYSAFAALLEQARETTADALILLGPFIDIEHPLVRTGAFDLPPNYTCEPDRATINDLFKAHVSRPLQQLAQDLPSISIILVPSVRDGISKHVAWPQARWDKKELGLPKQAQCVTNPVTLSLNEVVVGISSLDSLEMIRANEVVGGSSRQENVMARLCAQMIEQRSYLPVFPPPMPRIAGGAAGQEDGDKQPFEWVPMGATIDTSYLKLGEWLNVRPDVLITPSILTPFAKVIDSVVCVNPSTLSKRKGAGTFARLSVMPPTFTGGESANEDFVAHNIWERARVDCMRI